MKYLIARASTNSEWDNVSFAVVELSDEFIDFVKQAHSDAVAMSNKYEYGFCGLRFFGDNPDWLVDDNGVIADILKDQDSVVTDKPVDTEMFTRPEQVVKYGQIKISEDTIQFVAYGKHTDEEFWTETVPIKKITV